MTRDEIVALALIGSLAAWGALHAHIALKVASSSRWKGVVAFVVPPLAPYWAVKMGHGAWAVAWWVSFGAFGAVRVFLSG
jgi:hypothetical protein